KRLGLLRDQVDFPVNVSKFERALNRWNGEDRFQTDVKFIQPLSVLFAVEMFHLGLILSDEQIVLQTRVPSLVAVELFPTVKVFRRRGQHFDDRGWIDQYVAPFVKILGFATNENQIGIGEDAA